MTAPVPQVALPADAGFGGICLALFRVGADTNQIARDLRVPEWRVSRAIWLARCLEKGLPAEFLGGGIRKRFAL